MPTPSKPLPEPAEPFQPARAKVSSDLEQELSRALEEIARGEYLDLTPDQLDRWADSGAVPWSDEFLG